MPIATWKQTFEVSREALEAWHHAPHAFARLSPPWQRTTLLRNDGCKPGDEVHFQLHAGPLRLPWHARHEAPPADHPHALVDVQDKGPFRYWRHEHRFHAAAQGSVLEERVHYMPRFPANLAPAAVRRKLDALFAYRMRTMAEELARADVAPHTIAITGASGFIGRGLQAVLENAGHTVVPLARTGDGPRWDPDRAHVALPHSTDTVIHLAGEPINTKWTARAKERILASRRDGTRNLAEALAAMDAPPKTLISASAVGWYGDTGDQYANEDAPAGGGFLGEVVSAWEASADPAREAGIRVVHPRIGIVLHPQGGALKQMLTPFKLGAGGPIAGGKQAFPWVHYDDVLHAIHHAMTHDVQGPLNVVSPGIVNQRTFAKTLGAVLKRPSFAPMPKGAVKALFGQMGEELLVGGQWVTPTRLQSSDYQFAFPDLEDALRHLLGKAILPSTAK